MKQEIITRLMKKSTLLEKEVRKMKVYKKEINETQGIVFSLMEKSTFNKFEGAEVVHDLKINKEYWKGCWWGSLRSGLIALRDINENHYNADTLYILTHTSCVEKIRELAEGWNADEFGYTTKLEMHQDGISTEEVWGYMGSTLNGSEALIRIWWD